MARGQPKVLIIGIRSEFTQQITDKYQGRVTFRFVIDQERASPKLSGNFEYIISIVKFTNHTVERIYGKRVGFIRIAKGGGLTSLLAKLDELFPPLEETQEESSQ